MNRARQALFPAVLLACIVLIAGINRLTNPHYYWSYRASPDGTCSLTDAYPDNIQQWCPLLEIYGKQNNLDTNLLAAIMLQESNGNPQAYSKSGAVGLMQIMPSDGIAATFVCSNGPCFSNRPTSTQLYDPEFNIAYGAEMIANLLEKHDNLREALKAYGPIDREYEYADIVINIYRNYR